MTTRFAERTDQSESGQPDLILGVGQGKAMAPRDPYVFSHRLSAIPAEGGHGKPPWKTG